ncbi:hypothetical protein BH09PAT4_BH09PAT4_06680 [soil metagenome]
MTRVHVHDSMQDYSYELSAPIGADFAPDFKPDLTPQQMLELGVFGGHYFQNEHHEFPPAWFADARLSRVHDASCNYFEVDASQSLAEWQRKGWIYPDDPRGWFQWYCRYFLGRRLPDEDARQIRRWKQMTRHIGQIKNACHPGDMTCRRRQRQALLHWAYDSRKL